MLSLDMQAKNRIANNELFGQYPNGQPAALNPMLNAAGSFFSLNQTLNCSADGLKIRCSVFAERADEIGGKGFAFVYIAADFADITLLRC